MLKSTDDWMGRVSMTYTARIPSQLTADQFLGTDQSTFGNAWRYELVEGEIIGHPAPSPEHGRILAGLMRALGNRLSGNKNGCYPEVGSGAVPERKQRNTARIPDAMIRCQDLPRVTFEIISPSELKDWRQRDRKRRDVQNTDGVTEIVEICQRQLAVHIYRKGETGAWTFHSIDGTDAVLDLWATGEPLSIPLTEIYEFAMPADDAASDGGHRRIDPGHQPHSSSDEPDC
jgi:Uma2 family endonuclease